MTKEQDTELLTQVGQRLRQARDARGLNLHELARLCGISAPALSLIETGKRDPRLTTLSKIAAALRLSLGRIVTDQAASAEDETETNDEGYDLGDYR